MALPTVTVTPGTGQTVNTLPNAGQVTMANSLPVVIASDQSSFPITQPDPTKTTGTISAVDAASTSATNSLGQTVITGTPTASSFVSATLSGNASVRIQLVSTNFTGTVAFERSFDGGTTWLLSNGVVPGATLSAPVSSTSFTGTASTQIFELNAAGATNVRIRETAAVTNTLAVTIQPGYGVGIVAVPSTVPGAVGQGADFAVPAGSTNGTAITTAQAKPSGAIGVELIMDVGDSVSCTIATSAPGSPPIKARVYSYAKNGQRVYIDLAGNAMLYITNTVNGSTGSPLARWI